MSRSQIVLIEDNPADIFLVQLALKENDVDCELTLFKSGEEALRVLCSLDGVTNAFVPDVILLDLNTPRSDGFDVLTRLRQTQHLAQVPIAILTSSQATSDRDRIARFGGVRYIQKPAHLEAFLSTVSQSVREMLHA